MASSFLRAAAGRRFLGRPVVGLLGVGSDSGLPSSPFFLFKAETLLIFRYSSLFSENRRAALLSFVRRPYRVVTPEGDGGSGSEVSDTEANIIRHEY